MNKYKGNTISGSTPSSFEVSGTSPPEIAEIKEKDQRSSFQKTSPRIKEELCASNGEPIIDKKIHKGGRIEPDAFFTIQEIADIFKVNYKFIHERVARGDLRAVRLGRLRRVRWSEVEKWLNSQKRRVDYE